MAAKYNTILLVLLILVACNEEEPGAEQQNAFVKFYGTSLNNFGNDIKQTGDGGFIVIGTTETTNNGTDIYLVKTDAFGNKLWTKSYGNQNNEAGNCVQLLKDDGYTLCGTSVDTAQNSNILLLKTDPQGEVMDSIVIGSRNSYETGNYFQITDQGDYLVVGSTTQGKPNLPENQDIYIARIRADLDTILNEWNFGTSNGYDELNDIDPIGNDKYITIGTTTLSRANLALHNIIVMIIDASGYFETLNSYGGLENDYGTSIKRLPGGDFLVLGYSEENVNQGMNICLSKIDPGLPNGTIWTKYYGGSREDYAHSMQITEEDPPHIIIAGSTASMGSGNEDFYFLKTDTAGKVLYEKVYGYTGNETATALAVCSDEGFIFTGNTSFEENSMITLLKTYPDLELVKN